MYVACLGIRALLKYKKVVTLQLVEPISWLRADHLVIVQHKLSSNNSCSSNHAAMGVAIANGKARRRSLLLVSYQQQPSV